MRVSGGGLSPRPLRSAGFAKMAVVTPRVTHEILSTDAQVRGTCSLLTTTSASATDLFNDRRR